MHNIPPTGVAYTELKAGLRQFRERTGKIRGDETLAQGAAREVASDFLIDKLTELRRVGGLTLRAGGGDAKRLLSTEDVADSISQAILETARRFPRALERDPATAHEFFSDERTVADTIAGYTHRLDELELRRLDGITTGHPEYPGLRNFEPEFLSRRSLALEAPGVDTATVLRVGTEIERQVGLAQLLRTARPEDARRTFMAAAYYAFDSGNARVLADATARRAEFHVPERLANALDEKVRAAFSTPRFSAAEIEAMVLRPVEREGLYLGLARKPDGAPIRHYRAALAASDRRNPNYDHRVMLIMMGDARAGDHVAWLRRHGSARSKARAIFLDPRHAEFDSYEAAAREAIERLDAEPPVDETNNGYGHSLYMQSVIEGVDVYRLQQICRGVDTDGFVAAAAAHRLLAACRFEPSEGESRLEALERIFDDITHYFGRRAAVTARIAAFCDAEAPAEIYAHARAFLDRAAVTNAFAAALRGEASTAQRHRRLTQRLDPVPQSILTPTDDRSELLRIAKTEVVLHTKARALVLARIRFGEKLADDELRLVEAAPLPHLVLRFVEAVEAHGPESVEVQELKAKLDETDPAYNEPFTELLRRLDIRMHGEIGPFIERSIRSMPALQRYVRDLEHERAETDFAFDGSQTAREILEHVDLRNISARLAAHHAFYVATDAEGADFEALIRDPLPEVRTLGLAAALRFGRDVSPAQLRAACPDFGRGESMQSEVLPSRLGGHLMLNRFGIPTRTVFPPNTHSGLSQVLNACYRAQIVNSGDRGRYERSRSLFHGPQDGPPDAWALLGRLRFETVRPAELARALTETREPQTQALLHLALANSDDGARDEHLRRMFQAAPNDEYRWAAVLAGVSFPQETDVVDTVSKLRCESLDPSFVGYAAFRRSLALGFHPSAEDVRLIGESPSLLTHLLMTPADRAALAFHRASVKPIELQPERPVGEAELHAARALLAADGVPPGNLTARARYIVAMTEGAQGNAATAKAELAAALTEARERQLRNIIAMAIDD